MLRKIAADGTDPIRRNFYAEFVPPATDTPTAAASCRAKPPLRDARSGRRWSAIAPVLVGMLSTTYRRFNFEDGPAARSRREENSRV